MIENSADIVVKADNIKTVFGSQVVHHDVSCTVRRAEIVALIGGSGSGKSVLLREMIGLLRPETGRVELFGQNILDASEQQLAELRRRCGVLFQNGALFSALTVGENVAAPIVEALSAPAAAIKRVVELRLALSGLPLTVASKMPNELSGGMRKRAALARSLALDPELLFLDEPTSGLDPINARAFDQLIRSLCDSLKISVVLVTHDLDSLYGIVDRIIALGEGRVLVEGTLDQVSRFDDPWIQRYFSARSR